MLTIEEFYFLNNTLFNSAYIENGLPKTPAFQEDISQAFEQVKRLYNADRFQKANEATTENDFISTLLKLLGWTGIYQESFTLQGRNIRPDWTLLPDEETRKTYDATPLENRLPLVTAFCESKAYTVKLDSGKLNKDKNPHFQLIDYLNTLHIRYGFLTNARLWRLYDTRTTGRGKVFYEIDLEAIIKHDDLDAFKYFWHIFKKAAFMPSDTEPAPLDDIRTKSEQLTLAVEENLKAVIYGISGEDSLFEAIGEKLYQAYPEATMDEIYENSMAMLFRLLFIAYFEDNNARLLQEHLMYPNYSLATIYRNLADNTDCYLGWHRMNKLFNILDKGAVTAKIPLFNGGLFDPEKAPLLKDICIYDDVSLKGILERILFKTEQNATLFDCRRDYKSISVIHLGRIYEGLLEYRFEIADETIIYLECLEKGSKTKTLDGYFDVMDYQRIQKTHTITKLHEVKKGEIYLKSSSNSRKTTASYYTPTALSSFLVKEAIDRAIADGKKIPELKILDNACGSGHFLVEALNYLTQKAMDDYEHNPDLQALVETEKNRIIEKMTAMRLPVEPDEAQVLKRALLKKCIFGVDLNPFAVELARLSLWIDTFIFGTPLSFIEHHIKCGNALVGSKKADVTDFFLKRKGSNPLFQAQFTNIFDKLKDVVQELDNLHDTTAEDVEKSKKLYKEEIQPKLERLNRALDLVTFVKFKTLEKDKAAVLEIDGDTALEERILGDSANGLLKKIRDYAAKFRFFNYEIEFPEALYGFDCIMGNPPWDKTKFSDTDFFPQYNSRYRTMSNSEKKTYQIDLLDKPFIKARYDMESTLIALTNDYLKYEYPLNRGAGDGNLFRFFVEKNLSMMAKKGTLSYCLPSALMFEDGSKALREHIFGNYSLNFFYSFENRNGLFLDVDSRYKFALMQIHDVPQKEPVKTLFYLLEQNISERTPIPYDLETVRLLSPDHLAFMEMRSPKDLPILKKCYAAFPPLSGNWLDFRNELHMTADKELFIEKKKDNLWLDFRRELDMTNDKELFIEKWRDGLWPLYEGKMIWQFNPFFEQPRMFLDPQQFDDYLKDTEVRRMVADIYPTLQTETTPQIMAVLNALGLPYNPDSNSDNLKQLHKFIVPDRKFWRLGFRCIARDTDERTMIFSLLPRQCGAGNSVYSNIPKKYSIENRQVVIQTVSILRLSYAMSIFNALIFDYLARFSIQINANKTYLERLPIPQPTDEEIRAIPDYMKLVNNALKLTLANGFDAFAELAAEFGISRSDATLTNKQKLKTMIENDLIVARMYGVTKEDMEHILDSFKVLKSKKPDYVAGLLSALTDPGLLKSE